jgi:hypothetical protein
MGQGDSGDDVAHGLPVFGLLMHVYVGNSCYEIIFSPQKEMKSSNKVQTKHRFSLLPLVTVGLQRRPLLE